MMFYLARGGKMNNPRRDRKIEKKEAISNVLYPTWNKTKESLNVSLTTVNERYLDQVISLPRLHSQLLF